MKFSLVGSIPVLGLLLLVPIPSQADVIYTFTDGITRGPASPSTFGWSFNAGPSLLTSTTTITSFTTTFVDGVANNGTCQVVSATITNPATTLDVFTNFSGCPDFTGVRIANSGVMNATPLTHFGTYVLDPATVVISDSAAPEPGGLPLLSLGLIGAAVGRLYGRRSRRA
jgi:hypothetical protein